MYVFKNILLYITRGHRLIYCKVSYTIVDFYLFYGSSFDKYIKQCKCLYRYDLNSFIEQSECYVILFRSALGMVMSVVRRSVVVTVIISIYVLFLYLYSLILTLIWCPLPYNFAFTIHLIHCK